MLQIKIKDEELFDEDKNEFRYIKGITLNLEHSLISLQKWEAKWKKPFLSTKEKTNEEMLDYIKCMTLNPSVDPNVYPSLTSEQFDEIGSYINDPMTATTFYSTKQEQGQKETITAEIIYYDMIALNIPQEYRKWHLGQLLTLIRVCSVKNNPKKMSATETLRRNAELNKQRQLARQKAQQSTK